MRASISTDISLTGKTKYPVLRSGNDIACLGVAALTASLPVVAVLLDVPLVLGVSGESFLGIEENCESPTVHSNDD